MEKKELVNLLKIQIGLKSLEPYISDAVDLLHHARGEKWYTDIPGADQNDLVIQVANALKFK